MKKKLRQALVSYFVNDYNTQLELRYKLMDISIERFQQMMVEAERVSICYYNYCCRGMYHCCWFDEYTHQIWGLTEDRVRELVLSVFKEHAEEFNRNERIACCEDEYGIHIVMVARDVKKYKMDILIDLWKGEINRMKMDMQKERRKGKLLMAVQIIKSENEHLTGIPRVSREDIARWMKEDKSFIDELVELCRHLDKREIIKEVIKYKRVADKDKYYLYNGILSAWADYLHAVLNHAIDENFEKIIELHFEITKVYSLTNKECYTLLKECVAEYLKRIKDVQDEVLYTLDIVLEIADFNHSEDEFWDAYVQIIQGGKYILEK